MSHVPTTKVLSEFLLITVCKFTICIKMVKRNKKSSEIQPTAYEYEPSESEDEQEKILLNTLSKNTRNRPTKHAVLDIPLSSDDEDDEEGVSNDSIRQLHSGDSDEDIDSDIEGKDSKESGDLPDQRAWGKSRKNFYSTDYVDQDYGGFDGDDAELAELEEQEAREIQQRLAAELEDNDFSLDVFTKEDVVEPKSKRSAELIKTDLSQLTSKQKLSLLQKEAPELIGIVNEFRDIMSDILKRLRPALKLIHEDRIPSPELEHYIRTKYYLANNYALNLGFYLLLRARRLPVAAHPVVKRLLQYRQLLLKLEPIENDAAAKIDVLLEACSQSESPSSDVQKTILAKKSIKQQMNIISVRSCVKDRDNKVKTMKVVKNNNISEEVDMQLPTKNSGDKIPLTKASTSKTMPWQNTFGNEEANIDVPWNTEHEEDKTEDNENGDSKRAITWEMAKNKGLTVHRKKEDRNPRVKLRNKFRKAKIRRKGQIREPRKELQRYGGEMSGIKATLSKSIKLK